MILVCLECKDNNAAYVKEIMPGRLCGRLCAYAQICVQTSESIERGPQNRLDTVPEWSIIILTPIAGSQTANGRSRYEAPDAPTTGNAEPTPQSRPRRVVSPGRVFRSSRSGSGQVRDAAPSADRRAVRYRCGFKLWFFAALFLSGTIGLRAKRSCGLGPTQTRSQAGTQAHRGGHHLHWRGAPERILDSIAGPGEPNRGTVRHQGSSTKHR